MLSVLSVLSVRHMSRGLRLAVDELTVMTRIVMVIRVITHHYIRLLLLKALGHMRRQVMSMSVSVMGMEMGGWMSGMHMLLPNWLAMTLMTLMALMAIHID